MSDATREELEELANELNIVFDDSFSDDKLNSLVEESMNTKEDVADPVVTAPAPATTKPKTRGKAKPLAKPSTKLEKLRQNIAKAKKEAFATKIVTITNKDNRENSVVTTAPLSFENEHFGLAKNVPLDVPVELERALIEIAESTMMTQHKDEVKGNVRTGNKVAVRVKKYVVSYSPV